MVRAVGPRRGILDPFAQTIRAAHVARRDAFIKQWWTAHSEAGWLTERALWEAGQAMIMSTSEMFDACMFAGLEREASRFSYAADREDARHWLVPGHEGGRVLEVEQHNDGDWYLAGTDTRASGAA